MSRIIQAAQFAEKAHRGQTRKYTGRPYIEHPMRVAGRACLVPFFGEDQIAAAWMHDVLEDCPGFVIPAIFSPRCYETICELTNPSKQHPELNRAARKRMDREHLATVSRAAKIIKLIDRIDNLNEMRDAPDDFKRLYVDESRALAEALYIRGDEVIEALVAELRESNWGVITT